MQRRGRSQSDEKNFEERSILRANRKWGIIKSTAGQERASSDGEAAPILRMPRAEDGPRVSRLIAQCPPLSTNSVYCNLLQCTHFADTCILAERDNVPVGWISAYRPPAAREQLFVWQVAVHASERGTGLGGRMLDALIRRPSAEGTILLTATIAEANAPSWALFASFARRHGAQIARRPIFDRDVHFAGADETEHLVSIGPLAGGSRPSTGG